MTTLVEDLLLLARLDEGQPLKLSEVDLTQLVVETVSDEKVIAPGHHWRLELPDEPLSVSGDVSQLRQVLVNLLSNARKHTVPGTTVVTAVMKSPDGSALVTVTDDGGGHPAGVRGPRFFPVRPRRRGPHREGSGRRVPPRPKEPAGLACPSSSPSWKRTEAVSR